MIPIMTPIRLAALALLIPGIAAATPIFIPARDVSVSYQFSATGSPQQTYQLSYDAADQLARVDSPTGYYILASLPQGQAQIVLPALHAIIEAPDFSAYTSAIHDADGAQFTPLGTGSYAGLSCRKYLVQDRNGTATTCITPDGVILHFSGKGPQGVAEATALSVSYAPQPQANFAQPQGFAQLNLPPGAIQAMLNPQ